MIQLVIDLFILLTLVDTVMSFIPDPKNRRHPAVMWLRKIVDVPQKPIRQLLPPNIPFDPSPLVVILVLRMLGAMI
ncbi:MAG: YggT family protein [Bacteriovoracaceae bacterium]|nr:YggT family protein [Bacteriovoracaceae bacterium]